MKAKQIIKYVWIFLCFSFYFYLESKVGIRAFAIALFMALVYCRQNVLILAPLYLAAAMLAAPSLDNFILAAAPCVVIVTAYFIHYKLKKRIHLLSLSICTLISQIPMIILRSSTPELLVSSILGVLGAQLFAYCDVVVVYLTLEKRFKFRLTGEEVLASAAVLMSFGMGFSVLTIGVYNAYFSITAFMTMAAMFIDRRAGFVVPIALGLGASLSCGKADYLAISVMYGIVASAFGKENFYLGGIGLLAIDAIFRLFFGALGGFDYLTLIAPAAGVALFFAIPKRIRLRLSSIGASAVDKQAGRAIVNRDRKMVAARLQNLSKVFYEIKDILLTELAEKQQESDASLLTGEVCERCCSTCGNIAVCREALGGSDTGIVVRGLVLAALDNGKASILDTPSFLSSRCKRINGIITATNDAIERHRRLSAKRREINEGRTLLGEQMGGVGELMDELKKEIEKTLSYDTSLEKKILEELTRYNIGASEAFVYQNASGERSLTLTVKECDSSKSILSDTINELMGVKMKVTHIEPCLEGNVTAHYEEAPVYSVVYGERELAKEGEEINGDQHKVVKISERKVLLILADGMGTGAQAGRTSGYALSLIESLYRAGFGFQTIVGCVGRLLNLRGTEDFNALDIAVIDLFSGDIDFIKAGGRESFLLSNGTVEVIECGSLPVGISDEVVTTVEQRHLTTESFVVMVSDGVIDVVGRESLVNLLEGISTENPDAIAEAVITNVKRLSAGKALDDASILAAKIYKNSIS
jgi:stage II sporulation protein E